jgi:uncharacterized oligopeptide transporter (OPT) family protein
MLVLFLIYAAFAALVHELIVGLAAMHSGWFPTFAVALITLVVGMQIGFPPVALALLVGFSAATGPAFADMGYDLKSGYMLRGYGGDPAFERGGRRQQLFAAMFAFVIAGGVVLIAYPGFFAQNLVAPVDRVYVATIKAGAAADVAWSLVLWAIPGAIIQFLGGPRRQLGILVATGLLIPFPLGGAERHSLPRSVGALRQSRGHGSVRRRRDRGRCAVCVLQFDLEGSLQIGLRQHV